MEDDLRMIKIDDSYKIQRWSMYVGKLISFSQRKFPYKRKKTQRIVYEMTETVQSCMRIE